MHESQCSQVLQHSLFFCSVLCHRSRVENVVCLLWNVCLPAFALYVNAVVCLPEMFPQPELEATTSAIHINKRDGQSLVAQTYTAIHAQTHGEYTFRDDVIHIHPPLKKKHRCVPVSGCVVEIFPSYTNTL